MYNQIDFKKFLISLTEDFEAFKILTSRAWYKRKNYSLKHRLKIEQNVIS